MDIKTKQSKKKVKGSKDGTMSFIDHLEELRKRLIRYFVVLVICVLAAYFYRKEILDLIKKPVDVPLKKYTATSTYAPGTGQAGGLNLNTYDCQCRRINPIAGTKDVEKKPGDTKVETGVTADSKEIRSDSAGASSVTDAKETATNLLKSVTGAIDDFVMYFQVVIGKKPSPIFGSVPVSQGQSPQAVGGPIPDDSGRIRLSCDCAVKAPPKPEGSSMVFIGLPELFFTQMKVAIFAGVFISFPYLLIELWGFIGPALYRGEKKVFWIFSVSSYLFFIGGALFGYFIVFPYGFDFFLSLTQVGEIMPSLSIGAYLSFAIKLLLAFGAIFEMPLVVFILARMGILTPKMMIKQARVAVLVIFVASAVLTPPDPFTMVLMAGPLLMLYLISIGVCFVGLNKQKAALRAQGIEFDDDDDV